MRNGWKSLAAVLAGWIVAGPAAAQLRALACEPEWGALIEALAGERVVVKVATTAQQDPHRIEARPSLLAAARGADLLVCSGADLEAGWLPLLLRRTGNPRIQPGQPGHLMAAEHVPLLEAPERLDRSEGDVHPGGNPHIHTDPANIAAVGEVLSRRLELIDPQGASHYLSLRQAFLSRWSEARRRWARQAEPLEGVGVVVSHKAFPYLQRWLGLREVAAIEERPGIPPGPGHLARVLGIVEQGRARMVLLTPYDDPSGARWLSERTGLPVVALPYTIGGNDAAVDLISLFDDTLGRLLETVE